MELGDGLYWLRGLAGNQSDKQITGALSVGMFAKKINKNIRRISSSIFVADYDANQKI